MTRRALPHLDRALRFTPSEPGTGSGSCFHRAVALLLDTPAGVLAIGTVRAATAEERARIPNASREPFLHAWVEVGGFVYAPTLIERLGTLLPIERGTYYEANGVSNVHYLRRALVKRLAAEHGWSRHFLRNRPPRLATPLGSVLLAAAGIAYRIADGAGVIPL